MTIDALIVSFNTKDLLRQTLRTLAESSPQSVELRVNVIDNASADGSADMVAAEFPQVDLVRSERNLGFGEANNVLVRRSRADYVLLLNSDVIVTEDILTPLLSELQSDPRIVIVGPRLVSLDGAVQFSATRFPTLAYEFARVIRGKRVGKALARVFDSDALVREIMEVGPTAHRVNRMSDSVWATCWLMRRSDVPAHGIFDQRFPMYDEDLDFCRRAHSEGRLVRYVADVELAHVGGASTASSDHKHSLMAEARRRYYARHHGALTAVAYAFLVPAVSWFTLLIQGMSKPAWLSARRA